MRTFRCTICNSTNNQLVATEPEEYLKGSGTKFYPDPKNKNDFICYKCKKVVDDLMYDYQVFDLLKELNENTGVDLEAHTDEFLEKGTEVPDN